MSIFILHECQIVLRRFFLRRGEETFATAEGQELLKQWKVPENYICRVFNT